MSLFAHPFRRLGRRFGTRRFPAYHDLENHVPYLEVYGHLLVDVYACVHAFYEVAAPAADVASASRLLEIREQLAGLIESVPEAIGQLQFIYSNGADYHGTLRAHGQYGGGWEVANRLRRERVERLLAELRDRELIRSTTLMVVSCLPRGAGVGDAVGRFRRSTHGEIRLRARPLRETEFQEARNSLATADSVLADHFQRVGIRARPLEAREVASYFYHLFNQDLAGDWGLPLVYDYDRTPFNDAWLCQDWEFGDGTMRIGDYHHAFVSMNAKPQETRPRIVEAITTALGFNDVRVTLNVRRLDKNQQVELLRGHRNRSLSRMREPVHLFDRIKNPKSVEDIRAAEYNVEVRDEVSEANLLLSDLRSGREFLALCQLVVHFWARDPAELRRRRQLLVARFQDMEKARAVPEKVALYPVLRSSLPGSVEPLDRWLKVRGRMAADLVPLQRGFVGGDAPVSLFRNCTRGLVSLDLFSTSGPAKAPISFVAGATGQGKSYLVNQLVLQHMIDDALVIILDVGGSYAPLVSLLGGQYVNFDPGRPFCFNPLQVYAANGPGGALAQEPAPADRIRLCRALEALLTSPRDPGGQLDERLVNKVDRAVVSVFQQAVAHGRPFVTTTDLARRFRAYHVQGDADGEELAQRLGFFVAGGLYGAWTDGPTTVDLHNRLVCFDLQGISRDLRLSRALVPLIVNYINDLVMANRARRKIIVLDEMWQFVANPRLMEFIVGAWKTFRKENALLIGSTQNLRTDIAANPAVAGAVVQSTECWFLLPQGKKEEVDAAVELLHLTEGQRDLLEHLSQRHVVNDRGQVESWRELLLLRASNSAAADSGKLRVQPTPLEHWVATTSPNEVAYRQRVLERLDGRLLETLEFLAAEHPGGLNLQRSAASDP